MNREIKFRGYNDGWQYGHLVEMRGGLFIAIEPIVPRIELENEIRIPWIDGLILVDPETVAQYIGEKDEKDVEIYIGDRVQICVFTVSPWNAGQDEHFRGYIDLREGCIVFVVQQYYQTVEDRDEWIWREYKTTDPFGNVFEDWDEGLEWYLPLWEIMYASSNMGEFINDNIKVIGNIHNKIE